ncbi:hypothetical protein F5148DRAFT_982391 [Russula earlei]|uniref:Uncharacterized protein n=1 Tax=Russula earlei TaxID=71964 RepID=A0ACC0U4S3_9AGAM|nr:hypothetical protein F5148DRAFT_982391 [Russula earlei]
MTSSLSPSSTVRSLPHPHPHPHPQPPSPTSASHLPSLTYHTSLLPRSIPTPGLLDSAVSGAHYSGVESVNERRRSIGHSLAPPSPTSGTSARRQSFAIPDPNPLHLGVLDDIKDMYEGYATKELLQKRWRKDAVYEDPYTKCKGLHEIAPQWYALPRMYTKMAITGRRVLSSTEHPNRLILWQKHEYTIRVAGSKKVVESILVIDFDEDGKIARMVDQRRGEDPPTRWGAQHLRRLNGRVVPWVPWLGSHPKSRPNDH